MRSCSSALPALAFVPMLAMSACSSDGDPEAGADAPTVVEGEVRTDPLRFFGAFDGDAYVVVPCTDSEDAIPVVRGPLADELVAFHDELVPRNGPGETIFVDLLGEAVQEGDEVSFDILEVYRAGWEDWGCTWQPLVDELRFAASGTEPGWTVQIAMDSTVVLSRPAGTTDGLMQQLEGSLPAGWTAEGVLGGDAFTLDLRPDPCRNEMSGGYSHMAATFTLADSVWQGCGFAGAAAGDS